MIKKCKVCRRKFFTKPSRVKIGKGKYCSRKCYYKIPKSQECKEKLAKISFKTGRYKHKGYVFIYMPKHPFAKDTYVYEHRLVMEKILGRYLKPKERVHHLNKIRDDNRPENLKFFSNQSKHCKFERLHFPLTHYNRLLRKKGRFIGIIK